MFSTLNSPLCSSIVLQIHTCHVIVCYQSLHRELLETLSAPVLIEFRNSQRAAGQPVGTQKISQPIVKLIYPILTHLPSIPIRCPAALIGWIRSEWGLLATKNISTEGIGKPSTIHSGQRETPGGNCHSPRGIRGSGEAAARAPECIGELGSQAVHGRERA